MESMLISILCFSKGWSCLRFLDFVFYMYWFEPLPYLMYWIRLHICISCLLCWTVCQHSVNQPLMNPSLWKHTSYITALLEFDKFTINHYSPFSTQKVWQHGKNWPYLLKENPLKCSKNWKHLHKCCFHGHLSCFCLALNGKTMLGFWPEPKSKKVSKLSWLTSRQPGGLAELSRAAVGRGLKTLTPAPMVWWRDLAFQRKRDGGLCSKPNIPQGNILMHDGWNKIIIKWDQP